MNVTTKAADSRSAFPRRPVLQTGRLQHFAELADSYQPNKKKYGHPRNAPKALSNSEGGGEAEGGGKFMARLSAATGRPSLYTDGMNLCSKIASENEHPSEG